LLYGGKLCFDEMNKVNRIARLDGIKVPYFLKDIDEYKEKLREIAILNGITPSKVNVNKMTIDEKNKLSSIDLYQVNKKYEKMSQFEIKRFIINEIIPKTSSYAVKPPNIKDENPSTCTIL
jgi:hypothetical protein